METSILTAAAEDGAAIVAVSGEVDFSNAPEVADGIRDAVAEFEPPVVYVDLKDASFVDSTGLGALIEGYHAAAERECRFVVVNPTRNLRRVLSVTGLNELFGLTEIDDASIGQFGSEQFWDSEAAGA